MKVLLSENPNQYQQSVANYMQRLQPLQAALDAYTALGYPTVPTVAELDELQQAPRRFLVKMLTNRQPLTMTGGLPVQPDKFWDMMEKPTGAEEFVDTVQQLFPPQQGYMSNRVSVSDLEVVNGRLQPTQALKDALLEQSRFYATTQQQVDEYAQLQIVAGALNTIRQMPHYGSSFDTAMYLQKVLNYRGNGTGASEISINVQAVLNPR